MKEFKKKVAIVTGGSGGIGRAIALAFAKRGAKVAVADILVDQGEETVQMIKKQGSEAIFAKTDVSNSAEVQAFVNQTIETYGRLDYAVNNAGIGGFRARTADYPEEVWNRIIGINLSGVWLCMKHEIPEMLKQGKGAIVNTASALGLMALSNLCAYVAAKHGVVGLTKTAALEYATQGIRVNAVCPGFVETPMMEGAAQKAEVPTEEFYKVLGNYSATKRMGKAEEIAETVIWACSDCASYVTGSALVVDGGWTSGWPEILASS